MTTATQAATTARWGVPAARPHIHPGTKVPGCSCATADRDETLTLLVLAVTGDVDDEWLAELTRGTGSTLVRRLSAVDRSGGGAGRPDGPAGVLAVGSIRMDLGRFEVSVAGERVALTHQEFLLLQAFLQRPGQLLSRSRLLELAWGYDSPGPRRTVDVHVRRLRVKLGPAASHVVTVRGFGYRFEDDALPDPGQRRPAVRG